MINETSKPLTMQEVKEFCDRHTDCEKCALGCALGNKKRIFVYSCTIMATPDNWDIEAITRAVRGE